MKIDLTYARLREIVIDAGLGKPIPPEDAEHMADALLELLDEAEDADFGEHSHVGDLPGCLTELEKLRAKAVEENAEAEEKHEKKLESAAAEHERALEEEREKRLDMEKDLDEWRRRAEKAEHDLGAGVKNGHGIDQVSAARLRKLEAELVEAKVARVESAAAETAAKETNARLQAQMDRAAAFWQEKAEGELAAELSAVRKALAEETREKILAEKRAEESLFTVKRIAEGKPEDAHRFARIALGRDVLEKTGTEAREGYVPTRAERKRARAGK